MFHVRLRAAMDSQGKSANQLAKEIQKHSEQRVKKDGPSAAVKGFSRRSIDGYLKGVQPSPSFIEAAAKVLGVRFAWLAGGEGAMTETATMVAMVTNVVAGQAVAIGGRKDTKGALPTFEWARSLSPILQDPEFGPFATSALLQAWRLYSSALGNPPGVTPTRDAEKLVELIEAPLKAKGMRRDAEWSAQQKADYYVAMIQALKLAMRERGDTQTAGASVVKVGNIFRVSGGRK